MTQNGADKVKWGPGGFISEDYESMIQPHTSSSTTSSTPSTGIDHVDRNPPAPLPQPYPRINPIFSPPKPPRKE